MRPPLAGVVIPAHNEQAAIGRSLDTLMAGTHGAELDVVVVANACTDHTADIARSRGVSVIETEVPGKAHALRLGDAACCTFPRIYADADVQLDFTSVSAIVEALATAGILAAAPRGVFDLSGTSRTMRRVHHVHDLRMRPHRGLSGVGVYALSEAGHRRIFPMPDVIADDEFAHRSFSPGERAVVPQATSLVRPARTLRSHLRRRVRVRQGMRQLDRMGLATTDSHTGLGLMLLLKDRVINPVDAVVYAGVLVVDRLLGRYHAHHATVWSADPTTRSGL